jgi:hypothetical protein
MKKIVKKRRIIENFRDFRKNLKIKKKGMLGLHKNLMKYNNGDQAELWALQ